MPNRRNWAARSPLLRKGGVHQRSRSGERQSARQRLDDDIAEAISELREITARGDTGGDFFVASEKNLWFFRETFVTC